jgi:hypothetical protein
MIRTALPSIFGTRWKMTSAERSPTSSLPSQIGRRRGDFWGLSVMFSLQATMHEAIQGEKPTELVHGTHYVQRPFRSG